MTLTKVFQFFAIVACTILALWALGAVHPAAPFYSILFVFIVLLAIVGILYVAGLLKGNS